MLLQLAHLPVYIGGTFNSFHISHAGKGNYNVCTHLLKPSLHNIIVRTLCRESKHAFFLSFIFKFFCSCTDSEFASSFFFRVKMQTRDFGNFPSEFEYGLLGQLFTMLAVMPRAALPRHNFALICLDILKLGGVMLFTQGECSWRCHTP